MSKPLNLAMPSHAAGARAAVRAAWDDCLDSLAGLTVTGLPAERLFEALDGRIIAARSRDWLVEIYSVRREPDATWLQLAMHSETSYNILMRLAPDEGPKTADNGV